MKKILIILIAVIAVIAVGILVYRFFVRSSTAVPGASEAGNLPSSPAQIPASASISGQATSSNFVTPSSSLTDYIGSASQIFGALPTGSKLSIGTPNGIVVVKNFYSANPSVVDGGGMVIKNTAGYRIVYDRSGSSFWLAILARPFGTWQNAAEQDLLKTLGITESDACKLRVSSGVPYAPGDPLDGGSFPLSFCSTTF